MHQRFGHLFSKHAQKDTESINDLEKLNVALQRRGLVLGLSQFWLKNQQAQKNLPTSKERFKIDLK